MNTENKNIDTVVENTATEVDTENTATENVAKQVKDDEGHVKKFLKKISLKKIIPTLLVGVICFGLGFGTNMLISKNNASGPPGIGNFKPGNGDFHGKGGDFNPDNAPTDQQNSTQDSTQNSTQNNQ